MTKTACQKIVELAQQVNGSGSGRQIGPVSRRQALRVHHPAASDCPKDLIADPEINIFSQPLGDVRADLSGLTNFIKDIPSVKADQPTTNSGDKPLDSIPEASLNQYHRPYKIVENDDLNWSLLENFIAHIPDAVVTTSEDGVIQAFNERAERLFAYKCADVRGRHIAMLIETAIDGGKPRAGSGDPHQLSWRPISGEHPLRGLKKTGELFPIDVFESEYRQNGAVHRLYYIKDLTLTSRHEQRIAELETEIAYLSRHSVLGELATTITHELSQPLTAITNYTAAAIRCLTQPLPEQRDSGLDLIVKAGEQSKRAWLIMHRLRKLMQHRGIECARDDLRGAIEEAVQLATLGVERHGIQVAVDMPPEPVMVSMDRVHIQVLATNLIRNAIDELSTWTGEKSLWVRLKVRDGNLAEFSVEDTGAGIAPEIYENIFDPFHTTKQQGLGVGLAVSRRIAQAHGGRLSAENRPEGGAVFRFVVPMSMSEKAKNE
jgi:two-component system sensor kinase FixL